MKDLEEEIAGISHSSRKVLATWWEETFSYPPPKGISRRLLEYAVAYELQAKALGGLKPATKRRLSQARNSSAISRSTSSQSDQRKTLPAGSRLIREWHGRTYTVDVQESEFTYDGEQYASLSQVARAITGARWSGPRFFGL